MAITRREWRSDQLLRHRTFSIIFRDNHSARTPSPADRCRPRLSVSRLSSQLTVRRQHAIVHAHDRPGRQSHRHRTPTHPSVARPAPAASAFLRLPFRPSLLHVVKEGIHLVSADKAVTVAVHLNKMAVNALVRRARRPAKTRRAIIDRRRLDPSLERCGRPSSRRPPNHADRLAILLFLLLLGMVLLPFGNGVVPTRHRLQLCLVGRRWHLYFELCDISLSWRVVFMRTAFSLAARSSDAVVAASSHTGGGAALASRGICGCSVVIL